MLSSGVALPREARRRTAGSTPTRRSRATAPVSERRDEATPVARRRLDAAPVAATTGLVRWHEAEDWLAAVFARLHAAVGERAVGPDGALYGPAFFERHVGEVTAFVPVPAHVIPAGDVTPTCLPAGTYLVVTHRGGFDRLDEAYGALGAHVAANLLDTAGPVREHYLDDDTTEVLWPVRDP